MQLSLTFMYLSIFYFDYPHLYLPWIKLTRIHSTAPYETIQLSLCTFFFSAIDRHEHYLLKYNLFCYTLIVQKGQDLQREGIRFTGTTSGEKYLDFRK